MLVDFDHELTPGDLGRAIKFMFIQMIIIIFKHVGKFNFNPVFELLVHVTFCEEDLAVSAAHCFERAASFGELFLDLQFRVDVQATLQGENLVFVKFFVGFLIDQVEHLLVFDMAFGLLNEDAAVDQVDEGLADQEVHELGFFQLGGAIECTVLVQLGVLVDLFHQGGPEIVLGDDLIADTGDGATGLFQGGGPGSRGRWRV